MTPMILVDVTLRADNVLGRINIVRREDKSKRRRQPPLPQLLPKVKDSASMERQVGGVIAGCELMR
jgi:hypothetical protein